MTLRFLSHLGHPPACFEEAGDGDGGGGAAADGGGGGGGGPAGDGGAAGDEAGKGDGDDADAPLTKAEFKQFLRTYNKEQKSKRHQVKGGEGEGGKAGGGGDDDRVSRGELEAWRTYDRALGQLEGMLDADALEDLEDEVADLSIQERARYMQAYAKGLRSAAAKKAKDGGADDGAGRGRDGSRRNRRKPAGGGGEPPPAPDGGADYPETFEEYLSLTSSEEGRKRKAKLDKDPNFDLVALREKSKQDRARAILGEG